MIIHVMHQHGSYDHSFARGAETSPGLWAANQPWTVGSVELRRPAQMKSIRHGMSRDSLRVVGEGRAVLPLRWAFLVHVPTTTAFPTLSAKSHPRDMLSHSAGADSGPQTLPH